jgi:hypothetical protein
LTPLDRTICRSTITAEGVVIPEFLVDTPSHTLAFPRVLHRHPNGLLETVRNRTPAVIRELGGLRRERWTYVCACGEALEWERATESTTANPEASACGRSPPNRQ